MNARTSALWLPLIAVSMALPSTLGAGAPTSGDEVLSQAELERISEKIKGQIAKLRGQAFKHPVRVELQDKEGLIEYVKKRQDEFEPETRRDADEELARLFGLLPAGFDMQAAFESLLETQVGGFYDPSDDAFFLMESFTREMAGIILAHELVHALDDQWYDIDGRYRALLDSSDALQAYRFVVEGSATYLMAAWAIVHSGEIDMKALLEVQKQSAAGLEQVPAILWKPLMAAYIQGMFFMKHGEGLDEKNFVERAFQEPPRSMEQVLHPEKYWDKTKRDEPRSIVFELEPLPDGWDVLRQDTLGELYLALATGTEKERGGLSVSEAMSIAQMKYTNDAARGWDGDRIVLLGNGDARFVQMVTVWDSVHDAEEFEKGMQTSFASLGDGAATGPKRSVRKLDDVVVVEIRVDADDLQPLAWTVADEPVADGDDSE